MMRTARLIVAGMVVVAGSRAFAHANASCVLQARADMATCVAQCRDDFRSARFTCRGIDPACGKACLAGRQVCVDGATDILTTGQLPGGGTLDACTTGTAGCRAALEAARTGCAAPCGGDPACDACVDAAQVTAFICRDTCRESWRRNVTVLGLLQSCRTTFRTCVAACPKL